MGYILQASAIDEIAGAFFVFRLCHIFFRNTPLTAPRPAELMMNCRKNADYLPGNGFAHQDVLRRFCCLSLLAEYRQSNPALL